ncbi:unnamed protein product [Vitrella brassicaformis CCMP3155]|uniref:Uncharacterized protein n=1 Tax=Vitrella brassicaformis (strain CCMP3155) TaxID=1169540 RepID=A0A0G4ELX4_VITBC|nr:unnamed protein product [Vitrella brassicaformis CCMP3155]|eukprot:CEL97833.1 unnamed protein product [Vitrella brassicaformis CCMP3155]
MSDLPQTRRGAPDRRSLVDSSVQESPAERADNQDAPLGQDDDFPPRHLQFQGVCCSSCYPIYGRSACDSGGCANC